MEEASKEVTPSKTHQSRKGEEKKKRREKRERERHTHMHVGAAGDARATILCGGPGRPARATPARADLAGRAEREPVDDVKASRGRSAAWQKKMAWIL